MVEVNEAKKIKELAWRKDAEEGTNSSTRPSLEGKEGGSILGQEGWNIFFIAKSADRSEKPYFSKD